MPIFQDVSDDDFGLDIKPMPDSTKAIFTTNLFGHPSKLACNEWAISDHRPIYLIEDNSQSPFAKAHNGRYAGTNGTIGVWSLNVHKHIQCGEGGVITTNDTQLAQKLREFINHGEMVHGSIGLNLRMPEICAAVALSQLLRGKWIVDRRIEQAEAIIAAIGDIPGIWPPEIRPDCTHVYYTIPFLIDVPWNDSDINPAQPRSKFCSALQAEGVPIVVGYQQPLYRLPAFAPFRRHCPMAEDLQDRRLFYFENCAWTPTKDQIKQIGDAFRKAAPL
jgi:dTDP-4-amino-4,6-dideoxygalactose transaminase